KYFVVTVVVGGALVGSICGTMMMRWFYFNVVENLRFARATSIATLMFLGVFYADFSQTEFAGVTVPYPVNGRDHLTPPNLVATCNENCSCSQDYFVSFSKGRNRSQKP